MLTQIKCRISLPLGRRHVISYRSQVEFPLLLLLGEGIFDLLPVLFGLQTFHFAPKVVFHLDDLGDFGDRLAFLFDDLLFLLRSFRNERFIPILFDFFHLGLQYVLQQLDERDFLIDFLLLQLLVEGVLP